MYLCKYIHALSPSHRYLQAILLHFFFSFPIERRKNDREKNKNFN